MGSSTAPETAGGLEGIYICNGASWTSSVARCMYLPTDCATVGIDKCFHMIRAPIDSINNLLAKIQVD